MSPGRFAAPLGGALAVLALSASAAHAQTSASFDLSWSRVAGGGVTFATGANRRLGGTVGQAEAGVSQGSSLGVVGGFWPPPPVDGPTSAGIALAGVEAAPDVVRVAWFVAREGVGEVTVERARGDEPWRAVAAVSVGAGGLARFEDRDVAPGARLGYRLRHETSGDAVASGEVWVVVPAAALALEAVRPNPSPGALVLHFSLPARTPATIEVVDVGGRRVWSERLESPAPGSHTVRVAGSERLPAGVYLIRLRQSGRSVVRRAALLP